MPKIGKESITDTRSGSSVEITVYFSNKSKLFSIEDLPEEVMQWHEFMEKMKSGLSSMIEKADEFFGADSEQLLLNISSGKLLN